MINSRSGRRCSARRAPGLDNSCTTLLHRGNKLTGDPLLVDPINSAIAGNDGMVDVGILGRRVIPPDGHARNFSGRCTRFPGKLADSAIVIQTGHRRELSLVNVGGIG